MNVSIKNLDVDMVLKNKGVEFEIRTSAGFTGNLILTKTQLIWCKGKTSRKNGKSIPLTELIKMMEEG